MFNNPDLPNRVVGMAFDSNVNRSLNGAGARMMNPGSQNQQPMGGPSIGPSGGFGSLTGGGGFGPPNMPKMLPNNPMQPSQPPPPTDMSGMAPPNGMPGVAPSPDMYQHILQLLMQLRGPNGMNAQSNDAGGPNAI